MSLSKHLPPITTHIFCFIFGISLSQIGVEGQNLKTVYKRKKILIAVPIHYFTKESLQFLHAGEKTHLGRIDKNIDKKCLFERGKTTIVQTKPFPVLEFKYNQADIIKIFKNKENFGKLLLVNNNSGSGVPCTNKFNLSFGHSY